MRPATSIKTMLVAVVLSLALLALWRVVRAQDQQRHYVRPHVTRALHSRPAQTRAHREHRRRRRVRLRDPRIDPNEVVATSLSIGLPNAGRLLGAVELQPTARIAMRGSDHHFGTSELVTALQRAVDRVHAQFPGTAPIYMGDLSARTGGRLNPHVSHRNGRDVDVGFYVRSLEGKASVAIDRFVGFRRTLTSRQRPDLEYDLVRNWALIEALLSDANARVQYIFIFHELRAVLLDHARAHASAELVAHAEAVLFGDNDHRNHMHVRIYCPEDDRPRCRDERPFHPWVFPNGRTTYPEDNEPLRGPPRQPVNRHVTNRRGAGRTRRSVAAPSRTRRP